MKVSTLEEKGTGEYGRGWKGCRKNGWEGTGDEGDVRVMASMKNKVIKDGNKGPTKDEGRKARIGSSRDGIGHNSRSCISYGKIQQKEEE